MTAELQRDPGILTKKIFETLPANMVDMLKKAGRYDGETKGWSVYKHMTRIKKEVI